MSTDEREASGRELEIDVVASAETDDGLPPAVATGLYRIAQQAVANASQHARARRVVVHLTRSADTVKLRVEDDGAGFDPGDVPRDRFGLVGMRERARLLGGTLVVESAPEDGTAIDVRVPVRIRPPQSRQADP